MNNSIRNVPESAFAAELQPASWLVAPGKTTTIHVRLSNRAQTELNIDLSVAGIPLEWFSTTRRKINLQPGEQRDFPLRIHIPGDLPDTAGPFNFRLALQDDRGSPRMVLDGTLNMSLPGEGGRIGILMASHQFSVAPDAQITIPLTLVNQGLEEDHFKVSVQGLPPAWVTTTQPRLKLDAAGQKQIFLKIAPRMSTSHRAGRIRFSVHIQSESRPEDRARAECVLTLEAQSLFESKLRKVNVRLGETIEVVVENQGNIPETFSALWKTGDTGLVLEEVQRKSLDRAASAIRRDGHELLRLEPGEKGAFVFQTTQKSPPLFGGEVSWPYTVSITSSAEDTQTHAGQVLGRGLLPAWVLSMAALIILGFCCISGAFLIRGYAARAGATETAVAALQAPTRTAQALATAAAVELTQSAVFSMTQSVDVSQLDDDGDGLTNAQEAELGTDPAQADTDRDGLSDGDEVARTTDPRNPDTDGDTVIDGAEVQAGTDPLDPDSDDDGLSDGQEVERATNPLNPDTDNDGLRDGDETPPCPNPLNPDSDSDGIIDGRDINPCNPGNPSLTATAVSSLPTSTPTTPTAPAPAATATATPSLPIVSGAILFDSSRDGNQEIYAFDTTAHELFRLTNNPAADTSPAWAPNRTRFAFVSDRDGNREIYVVNLDGSNLTNLTNNPAEDFDPAWSADGTQIAFTTNRDGNREIYVMNADGSNPVNLTNNPASDSEPAWFIDRVVILDVPLIAFTTDRDGNREVYSMTPEGAALKNLTNHPGDDFFPVGFPGKDALAFTTNRDGNLEIYRINPEGGGLTNLTNNPAADRRAAWSPDGSWLAVSSNRDGNDEIYMFQPGGQVFRLTNHPERDWLPSW